VQRALVREVESERQHADRLQAELIEMRARVSELEARLQQSWRRRRLNRRDLPAA
jgi:hypothetical protein